jgi:hypothetical protein
MHLALLLMREVHDRCRAATAQDDKSAQPMPHSAPSGKTRALAAVQHGTEHAFAFEPGQLTTRRKAAARFVAATICLAWPYPADWQRRGRIKRREFRSIRQPARTSSAESPQGPSAQYASRTRKLKQDRREFSLLVRWIWFDLAPRCPLPSGRIKARSRFTCRHDSDG